MLGVVVSCLGKTSETYISSHIANLSPAGTAVCTLSRFENPAWVPEWPVLRLYQSDARLMEALRRVVGAASREGLRRIDLMRIAFWLASNHIDVVLCEYLQVAVSVADVCRRMGVPVVAHAHGYDVTGLSRDAEWRARYREVLPGIDAVVVVSRAMKAQVMEFGVPADRIHVIPCGTDVRVGSNAQRHSQRELYKLVAVGRMIPKKGPIFLLESFRRIRQACPKAELFVVGQGDLMEAVSQFVRATALEHCVHLLGELPNASVRLLLADADLFLQHSVTAVDGDEEGLPVSILEAMAEGVPVVSTYHAGIPEAVQDGETGFLVRPGDCQAMADRSVALLCSAELRNTFGLAAQERVKATFSSAVELRELRLVLANCCPAAGGITSQGLTARADAL